MKRFIYWLFADMFYLEHLAGHQEGYALGHSDGFAGGLAEGCARVPYHTQKVMRNLEEASADRARLTRELTELRAFTSCGAPVVKVVDGPDFPHLRNLVDGRQS